MPRARKRDWTLGELDRTVMYLLWWNADESRWSVEPGHVVVLGDGEAILQLAQDGEPA